MVDTAGRIERFQEALWLERLTRFDILLSDT